MLISLVLGIVGWSGLHNVNKMIQISDNQNEMIKMVLEARRHEKNYILRKEDAYIEKVQCLVKNMLAQLDGAGGSLEKDTGLSLRIGEYISAFNDYVGLEKEKNEIEKAISSDGFFICNIGSEVILFQKKMRPELAEKKKEVSVLNDSHQKELELYIALVEKQKTQNSAMVTSARSLIAGAESLRQDAKNKMASVTVFSINLLKGFVGGSLIAGILSAVFLVQNIIKVLSRVVDGLEQGSRQISAASFEVSSSSQSLAEGASQQAAALEETASSLEQISSMTKKNSANAQQANSFMQEMDKEVRNASESMQYLSKSMQDVAESSKETSKIIKLIDEIAFKTNLLSLNAAVEAARAGEAGQGFAVVAEEVRTLAMQSADAAKNTSDMIRDIVDKIHIGSGMIEETNKAFSRIAGNSVKGAQFVNGIADASMEQSDGIEQVNIAVSEMDKVVQQNAASAEESASASEELNAQAEEMQSMVDGLLVLIK